MRVVVQRVKKASVKVNSKVVGKCDYGYLLLVSFTEGDNDDVINFLVKKICAFRIMDDEFGVMNKSILDIKGSILSISQFTLYANCKKGNRPSYIEALNGEKASLLYDKFNQELSKFLPVETGIFGAEMEVSLINDGPVTILLEKENKK